MFGTRIPDYRYQVLVTLVLFFGLFVVEYPPLFVLGYWGWGYWPHKIISGAFIVLNLFLTQYSIRRWGFFRRTPMEDKAIDRATSADPVQT